MSLLRRAAPSRSGEVRSATITDELFARRRRLGTAGQVVTEDTANRLMAVWRCKHLLADVVSGLPIDQFRERDGLRVEMPKSEFVRRPSDFLADPEAWRYQMMLAALSTGNGVALITQLGSDGLPRRAEVLGVNDWSVARPGGSLAPPVWKVGGKEVDPGRILHMPAFGPVPGSVLGMSPLDYAAQTIGLGMAVRGYGASWYEGGGHPTGLLISKKPFADDTVATRAKEKFREATSDDHLAVVDADWDYKQVQVSPDQALFLNATNATTVDICGYFGIPPELLGYAAAGSGSVTYANREQRAIDVLVWTVQWWIGRVERLISRQLPQPQFVKINVDALLRSDAITRWKTHDIAVRVGARSVDEVRRLEDQPPIPGGDRFLWPPYSTAPVPTEEVPA